MKDDASTEALGDELRIEPLDAQHDRVLVAAAKALGLRARRDGADGCRVVDVKDALQAYAYGVECARRMRGRMFAGQQF